MYFDRVGSLLLQSSPWLQKPLISHEESSDLAKVFQWDNVTPHKHFQWEDCFGDFKCARLQVPMDWLGTSTEANKTVEIAVIKVEATVSPIDPTYGGAIVLNPGGPGGSGVDQILKGGQFVRTVLSAGPDADTSVARNYDIIGFDPRGVNHSRPLLSCFPNHLEAAVFNMEDAARGYIDTSDTSFDNAWASYRALAEGCSKRAAEEGIGKHMSTPAVARDIVEIFERHGEWRENEARRLLRSDRSMSSDMRSATLQRSAWRKGQETIQYWGFSYGTVLGATLSTMFPERISRAVLDGVADSHDYMRTGWTTNLRDTDITFVRLADYCYQGGKEHCPLWHEDGPAAIAENVQRTISDLKYNPISLPGTATHGPTIVTYDHLKRLIRDIVYNPLKDFPFTAQVLHELSNRNGTTLAKWVRESRPDLGQPLSEECLQDGPYSPACASGASSWEATYGIACSDGPGVRLNQTKEQFREYADKIIAQSALLGAHWASIMLPCTAWYALGHWRYDGNFHNATAHPILFTGNTVDPVTPLANAFMMAGGFKDAGVLHQDHEGHCTYSSVSMCAGKAIRHYFQTGDLPGTAGGLEGWEGIGGFCEPDRKPFDGYSADGLVPELPSRETDKDLWEALVGLNRVWP